MSEQDSETAGVLVGAAAFRTGLLHRKSPAIPMASVRNKMLELRLKNIGSTALRSGVDGHEGESRRHNRSQKSNLAHSPSRGRP
jgi:hypothetical protein